MRMTTVSAYRRLVAVFFGLLLLTQPGCPLTSMSDADGDGVPDGMDLCAEFDDALDDDRDGVPDGCDVCAGADDAADADGDGIADGCDQCEGFDDQRDDDQDGVPNGCDVEDAVLRADLVDIAVFDEEVDLSNLRVGDEIVFSLPDNAISLIAGRQQTSSCTCRWSVSPQTAGVFDPVDECSTTYTVLEVGAALVAVVQTCDGLSSELYNGVIVESDDQGNNTDGNLVAAAGVTAIASASPQQAVEGDTVTLDGTDSSGADEDELAFAWIQIGFAPLVSIQNADEAVATFVAPDVSADTEFTFQLTVSEGDLQDSDTVTVVVSNASPPPGGGGSAPPPPPPPPPPCVPSDCDDGVFCNGQEVCVGNTCVPGSPPVCDDGLFCNGVETCGAGDACVAGTPPCPGGAADCDDALDVCLCPGGTDPECDDGDFCNGPEVCGAGNVCEAGVPPVCDDGVFCNGAETCAGASCQAGAPVDCDDGVDCTTDSCNLVTDVCDNTTDNGACDDGVFCNGAETCDAVNGCTPGADPCPGQFCDEGGGVCQNAQPISGQLFRGDGTTLATQRPITINAFPSVDNCQTLGASVAQEITTDGTYGISTPFLVPTGFTGCVIPAAEDVQFVEAVISYNDVQTPFTNQDFDVLYSYYVDGATGNDTNTGTQAAPYATIQQGANVAFPGDTVLVGAGTYAETVAPPRSGISETRRIVFKNLPGQMPAVDGQGVRDRAWSVDTKTYITIQGFEIRNTVKDALILNNDADFVTMRYCRIHDCAGAGVFVRGGDNAVIEWNEIFRTALGVNVGWRDTTSNRSNDAIVRNNLVYNNGQPDTAEGADGITVQGGDDADVHHNFMWLNLDDGIDISGQSARFPERANVHHNVDFKNGYEDFDTVHTGNGDGNGIKVSTNVGGDHLIHHNLSIGNKRAGFDMDDTNTGWPNDSFYNNIAWRNGNHDVFAEKAGFIVRGASDPIRSAPLRNNVSWGNNPTDRLIPSTRDDLFEANLGVDVDESDHNVWGSTQTQTGGVVDVTDVELGSSQSTDPDPGLFVDADTPLDVAPPAASGDLEVDIPAHWQQLWDQVVARFTPDPSSPLDLLIDKGVVVPGITDGFSGTAPDIGMFESP